jgi:hypothetical protein
MKSGVRRWNCGNCGRANRTSVATDGTARCEYCTDWNGIGPLRPWKDRLFGYPGRLVSLLTGETPGAQHRPAARGR